MTPLQHCLTQISTASEQLNHSYVHDTFGTPNQPEYAEQDQNEDQNWEA